MLTLLSKTMRTIIKVNALTRLQWALSCDTGVSISFVLQCGTAALQDQRTPRPMGRSKLGGLLLLRQMQNL